MVMEFTLGKMEGNMKDNINLIKNMVMEYIPGQIVVKFEKNTY